MGETSSGKIRKIELIHEQMLLLSSGNLRERFAEVAKVLIRGSQVTADEAVHTLCKPRKKLLPRGNAIV